jgi:hypothetical protein
MEPTDYKKFNEFLNNIPIEELQARNDEELDKTAKDFEEFKTALAQGKCSFCGYELTHLSKKRPCFHWLLGQTKGFKKKHFPLLYQQKSFHQINPYLRWVANSGENPLRNINDLVEERSSSKLIEETIRYKNLEWSFSCSHGDMQGHRNSHDGQMPHYHFQMKVDDRVVINYNAFHIPFSDYDHFCFAVARGEFDRLKGGHIEGAGMQALFEKFAPEELLDLMQKSPDDDESRMQFNIQTLVEADEGTTISGDALADIMEEHNRTGVPMAKLLQKLENIRATSFITPGPGVPDIASRTPNRKRGS